MPKSSSIYRGEENADDRELCASFKQWLAEYYDGRHGSLKKFADDLLLKTNMVYRQLNGTDPLSDELRAVIQDCMRQGRVR